MKIVPVGRTWVDSLIFWLNTPAVTFMLLVIGIVCIYIELHMMTGLLGIISAVCFAIFFWSRFLGGTAGWLEVILFLLGLGCLLMEIFVIPGFGVFGVSGILLILGSLLMASQTFGHIEPHADMRMLASSIVTLTASVIAVLVISMIMSRYLPRMPLFSSMILTPPGLEEQAAEPRLRPELAGAPASALEAWGSLVGEQGVTLSVLRPAGKAQIAGNYIDVVSEGPWIPAGSTVEVVSVSGNRVFVREV
jgi:membrane-bound serine protease (ClpP class)